MIGKILLDTDISPENILCLTYTDAGTIALGGTAAEKVWVAAR